MTRVLDRQLRTRNVVCPRFHSIGACGVALGGDKYSNITISLMYNNVFVDNDGLGHVSSVL